jgi:hypothetical protein
MAATVAYPVASLLEDELRKPRTPRWTTGSDNWRTDDTHDVCELEFMLACIHMQYAISNRGLKRPAIRNAENVRNKQFLGLSSVDAISSSRSIWFYSTRLVYLIHILDAQRATNPPSREISLDTTHFTSRTSSPTIRGYHTRFPPRLHQHRFFGSLSDTGNRFASKICSKSSAKGE